MSTRFNLVFFGIGIIVLSFALRLINLNSLPIFADESIYIRWAQIMRAEPTLRFLPLSDGKQPLYMWATIPFFKVISDPLLAGRIFSGLTSAFTVFGVAYAAYLLFKNYRIAFISGLIWAIVPFSVFFGRMALVDSLLTLFIVWAFNFSYLAFTKNRLDMAMITGFCLGFAWLTKSPAIFAILLLPINAIFIPKPNLKKAAMACLLWLVIFCIAFAMYNILRLGPEFHMISIRNKDYVYSFSELLKHPTTPLISHLKDSFQFFLYLTTPPVLFFAIFSLFGKSKDWRQKLVLATWFLVPIFIQSLISITLTARYLLFTLPFAVILAAYSLQGKHKLAYFGLGLSITVCLICNSLIIFKPEALPLPRIERAGYLEEWTAGTGIKEVSQYLINVPGQIIVGSEGFFGTPFDALGLYLNKESRIRVVGVGVLINSVDSKLSNALVDNKVFLVVNSSRFRFVGDPSTIGLQLIASYPKAVSPSGQQEKLLFFKVLP